MLVDLRESSQPGCKRKTFSGKPRGEEQLSDVSQWDLKLVKVKWFGIFTGKIKVHGPFVDVSKNKPVGLQTQGWAGQGPAKMKKSIHLIHRDAVQMVSYKTLDCAHPFALTFFFQQEKYL